VRAGVAVAAVIDRREVAAVRGGDDVEPAVDGVQGAVAGHPGRHDAVERVGPGRDRGEEVVRLGDPQQVAGLVHRELLTHPADDRAEVLLLERAADAEAVEPAAVDLEVGQATGGPAAQVLVLGALDHPEQSLVGPLGPGRGQSGVLGEAAHRPGMGAIDRLLLVPPGIHQGGQLVEREHDVGPEFVLDPHRHLRREPVQVAVEVGAEGHPVVVHVRQPGLALGDHVVVRQPDGVHREDLLEADAEAHHLEAAGVGEGGAGPVHEPAQAAGGVHHVGAGLEVQVVGVGEDGLGAEARHRLGQHGLDGRLGADRHERRGVDLAVRGADHAGATRSAGQVRADGESEPAGRPRRPGRHPVHPHGGRVSGNHARSGPGAGPGRPRPRSRCAAPYRRSTRPCRRPRGRPRPPGR